MDTEEIRISEDTMRELSKFTIIKRFEEIGSLRQLENQLHRYKRSYNIIANFEYKQLFEEKKNSDEEVLFGWSFDLIRCPSSAIKDKILVILQDEDNIFTKGPKKHL